MQVDLFFFFVLSNFLLGTILQEICYAVVLFVNLFVTFAGFIFVT